MKFFQKKSNGQFCKKNSESDKVRDHCHLTGKYKGPPHNTCNINVTQNESTFTPYVFHNFSNYSCHLIFKKLVDKKNDKVKFKNIPKTNEDYISVTYGCIRFIDRYQILSLGLDILVNISDNDDLNVLRKEFPDKWHYSNTKLAYPREHFNILDDYKKPVDKLKIEDFFSKLKNKGPSDDQKNRTKESIKIFSIKKGEQQTKLHLKSDVIFLADVFEEFYKVSTKEMVLIFYIV